MSEVRIERRGSVGWLIFDHEARRNAMTLTMWQAVPALCRELEDDPAIRVVVLRGAGERAFVAGADISQFQESRSGSSGGTYESATEEAYAAIATLAKPVLACIHGFCIGGGLAIALSADVRYFADDVRFALPPAKLGIGYSPDGLQTLADLVGPAVAKEMVYGAELYDAETGLRWGVANHVLAKAELDTYVQERAEIMATRAPLSQLAAKLAIAKDERTAEVIRSCFTSNDYAEGVSAFMEKRTPDFTGR